MKVIDLLNKIANRDYIPTKIKWRDKIWEYDIKNQEFYDDNGMSFFAYGFTYIRGLDFLNDDVQIENL